MRQVAVFSLVDVRHGGWPTFTAHLMRGLRAAGAAPRLFKVGDSGWETQARSFGRGEWYWNATVELAAEIACQMPAIVAAASPARARQMGALAASGATVVIHDPTEVKGPVAEELARARHIVAVRPVMAAELRRQGLPAEWIQHPYERARPRTLGELYAVAFSRIDFDKHTELICQANRLVEPAQRVALYGSVNRMYEHHRLERACPGWRTYYQGSPGPEDLWAGARLAARARYAVDMSLIRGDGGGTQYTHLEAWDAGTRLILHRGWLRGDAELDTVAAGAAFVDSAEELADELAGAGDGDLWQRRREAGDRLLQQHEAGAVAARYLERVA